ncbi:MAG: enoyl-CoA hydratase [Ponticaulis sp.]|nr:enoyl-CoA hydratase [Ponticaulis sp.]|tara:strand:+ start:90274 stop:91110 length:837 start_codon:yes stop_codon:yes gene_type:complete
MSDRVRVEIKDHIADVKLFRADKMNALDNDMFNAIIETAAELDANRNVRVVVLSGEGRAFCAGLDTSNFKRTASGNAGPSTIGPDQSLLDRVYGISNRAQQPIQAWRQMHCPVIAAVHGVAFGGGFQLALGPDIRIVHPETKMSIMEAKWGLIPDMGGTPIMRGLVGDDLIRELTYTARIFNGTQAKEYGFATHLSETPYDDAMALAREIAARSPSAVQASKLMLNKLHDATVAEALITEAAYQEAVIGKPNQVEAVKSQLEQRPADYDDTEWSEPRM